MKKAFALLLTFAMILSLVACGGKSNSPSSSGSSGSSGSSSSTNTESSDSTEYVYPETTIRIGYAATEDSPTHRAMVYINELLDEKTGGAVQFELLGNGVLGSEDSMLVTCMDGSLDAVVTGLGGLPNYAPLAMVEDCPFLFDNFQQVYAAYDGEFGDLLIEKVVEPCGIKFIEWFTNGFRHFTNNIHPITCVADFEGIKWRTAPSTLRLEMFALGNATATAIPFSELYTALQTGTVDGQENPLISIYMGKHYEVQKYLSLSGHIYSSYLIAFSNDCWDSLDEKTQEVILECCEEGKAVQRQLSEEYDEKLVAILEEEGMIVNEVDKTAFREELAPVWDIFLEEYGEDGRLLLETAQKYIK